jgi:EAL domain-containing protein (putative c-di-GMP-specific phosphodiesterase class I)
VTEYKRLGFTTAIDDFGAGYSGLGLLVDFQPDLIKIDMKIVRDIDSNPPRQAVVRSIVALCRELRIRIVAEGVESLAEYAWLANAGIELFQGYYFARPAFEALPAIDFERLRLPTAERERAFRTIA